MDDEWDDVISAPSQSSAGGACWNVGTGGTKPPGGRGRGTATLVPQMNKISLDESWGVGTTGVQNSEPASNGYHSSNHANGTDHDWEVPAAPAAAPVKAPSNFADSWNPTPTAAAPVKNNSNFADSWNTAPTAVPARSQFKNDSDDQPRGGGWGSSAPTSNTNGGGGWKGAGGGGGNRSCHKVC